MMSLCLEICVEFKSFTPIEVWNALKVGQADFLNSHDSCEWNDMKTRLRDVGRELEASKELHFTLSFQSGEIRYGHIGHRNLSVIWIRRLFKDLTDADKWVRCFCHSPSFIQAWVYEPEYKFWQNARSPLEYRAKGKSSEGLPLISNGLPFPLQEDVIDTSNNPGRRIVRYGYIEAVGAVMWLGPLFMERTGLDTETLRSISWLGLEPLPNDGLMIKASDQVFDTAEGEQGKRQRDIRNLLFGNVKSEEG